MVTKKLLCNNIYNNICYFFLLFVNCMSQEGEDGSWLAGIFGLALFIAGAKILGSPSKVGNVIFFWFALILMGIGAIFFIA